MVAHRGWAGELGRGGSMFQKFLVLFSVLSSRFLEKYEMIFSNRVILSLEPKMMNIYI